MSKAYHALGDIICSSYLISVGDSIETLMHGFRLTTGSMLVLAIVLFLALLAHQGRRALPELVPGAFVFGLLVGTVSALLSAAWCYFVAGAACVPGDALLGGPMGFALGVLWFLFWWWHEARPD
jgi:hypothetical protein